jgi:WD40 repeat protein
MASRRSPALLARLALALAAVTGAIGGAGCGDSVGPSSRTGSLVVHTATTGVDPDADGYRLTLDADDAGRIGPNASATLAEVSSGDHAVGVDGLALNCEVAGDNPRTVAVPAGDILEVSFAVSCSFLPATVIVTTSTSGSAPDVDGYLVSVDGAAGRPVGNQDSLTLDGVAPGSHTFRLSGLTSNCTVAGANPRLLTVEPGATARLAFSIACAGVSPAHLLFTGQVDGASHVLERASDGSITDLTPGEDGDEARWSPDGSRIVFTSVRSGTLGIYLMDADGRHVVQLTNNGEVSPSWSPDGTRILFWPYVTVGFGEIMVMNADGSHAHAIGQGSNPAWSPDGTRIAFERAERDACILDLCALNIYTMALDGTDVRKLTSNTQPFEYAAVPAWSPDGTMIAYLSGDPFTGANLRVMTSAGASVRGLGVVSSPPVWSSTGAEIAVAQTTAAGSRIVAIPVGGGQVVELVDRPDAFPTSWR